MMTHRHRGDAPPPKEKAPRATRRALEKTAVEAMTTIPLTRPHRNIWPSGGDRLHRLRRSRSGWLITAVCYSGRRLTTWAPTREAALNAIERGDL